MNQLAGYSDAGPRSPPARQRPVLHCNRVFGRDQPDLADHAVLGEQRADLSWPSHKDNTNALPESRYRAGDDRGRCVIAAHRVNRDNGAVSSRPRGPVAVGRYRRRAGSTRPGRVGAFPGAGLGHAGACVASGSVAESAAGPAGVAGRTPRLIPRQLSDATTSRATGQIIVECMAVTSPAENTSLASLCISLARLAGVPGGSLMLAPWVGFAAEPCWAEFANPVMNLCLASGGSVPACCTAATGSDAAIRFWSRAPTAAVPITAPTCRTVLIIPEAAPATRGSIFRIAMVVIGAKVQPIPTPAMARAQMKSCHCEVGVAITAVRPKPTANNIRPDSKMYFPPILSVILPATGATNIETIDAGAIVRPALSAE